MSRFWIAGFRREALEEGDGTRHAFEAGAFDDGGVGRASALAEAVARHRPFHYVVFDTAEWQWMRRAAVPGDLSVASMARSGDRAITRDISLELHHRSLPQRLRTPTANEPWNLQPAYPWSHAEMAPYRHTGYVLERILNGTNSF